MKKLSLFIMLIFSVRQLSIAQTIITGTVKDELGYPIHYAFVKEDKLNNATFTDTLGNFSLTVDASSKITIMDNGYSDVTLVPANTSANVILKGTFANKPLTGDTKLLISAFTNANVPSSAGTIGPAGIPVFTDRQVVGYRFKFTQWVHGYMVKTNGDIIFNSNYLFNYDKIKGDLFISLDGDNVTVADKNVIKSFVLVNNDIYYNYEQMPGISTTLFSQVISAGKNYKIYKLTATKFVKSNYVTNGISSSGNNYDEYADENTYYAMNLKSNAFQPFALKKKAIKAAFSADADKVNAFMTAHNDDKLDDTYLMLLGETLNN